MKMKGAVTKAMMKKRRKNNFYSKSTINYTTLRNIMLAFISLLALCELADAVQNVQVFSARTNRMLIPPKSVGSYGTVAKLREKVWQYAKTGEEAPAGPELERNLVLITKPKDSQLPMKVLTNGESPNLVQLKDFVHSGTGATAEKPFGPDEDIKLIAVETEPPKTKSTHKQNLSTTSLGALCILLCLGKLLRMLIKPLRDLYLPSSIIGGTVGLLILTAASYGWFGGSPGAYDSDPREDVSGSNDWHSFLLTYYTAGWRELPELLICVIFASVFIGVEVPPAKAIWDGSGPQIMYGQIVTHGLWVSALTSGAFCAWVWSTFCLGVDNTSWFGRIYPTNPLKPESWYEWKIRDQIPWGFGVPAYMGFEGGHGTTCGLAEKVKQMSRIDNSFAFLAPNFEVADRERIFTALAEKEDLEKFTSSSWEAGGGIGVGFATTGLMTATVMGVWLIGMATKRGWRVLEDKNEGEELDPMLLVGIYAPEKQTSMGNQTTVADSIDTLTIHAALVGCACYIGYILTLMLNLAEGFIRNDILGYSTKSEEFFMSAVPLFPFSMIAGMLVDKVLRLFRYSHVIDHNCMQRVSGAALDFLICASMATMNFGDIVSFRFSMISFLIVNVACILWHLFCILYLAKRMLPDCWFERAIFEVGHSCGTTANGILLLKIVDPHAETAAHSSIAFKLIVHEPLMGLWLAWVLYMYIGTSYHESMMATVKVICASLVALAIWFAVYFFHFRRQYKETVQSRKSFVEGKQEGDKLADEADAEDAESLLLIKSQRPSLVNEHDEPEEEGKATELGHYSALSSTLLRQKELNGGSHLSGRGAKGRIGINDDMFRKYSP